MAAHYGNWLPADPQRNLITLIDLTSGARQTFVMGDPPLGSVGAGIKYVIAKRLMLRTEFRDYLTPFPTEVITPAKDATFGRSILHDFVPMFGLSYLF